MKIDSTLLNTLSPAPGPASGDSGDRKDVKGFGEMLKDAVKNVNERLINAEEMANRLALGDDVDIAQVMSAMTKADISFRLLLQVRNKALNAYEEIMRMQF